MYKWWKRKVEWDKQLDDKLLKEISEGKKILEISTSLKCSSFAIQQRIKEMGFDGLKDARKVMSDI